VFICNHGIIWCGWLKEAILTLILATISSPSHITSKLIWEGRFASWTSNCKSKFVVAVERHCTCNFFCYSWSAQPHFPSTMLITSFFQSIWVVLGYKFALHLLIKSFQNSEGKMKSNKWKAVNSNELEMMKCWIGCSLIHSTVSGHEFLTSPTHHQTICLQLHHEISFRCWEIFNSNINKSSWNENIIRVMNCASTLDKLEKLWRHHFTFCCQLKYIITFIVAK